MEIEWGEWTRLAILILAVISLGIWMAKWFAKYEQWARGMDEFREDTKKALAELRADTNKAIAELRADTNKAIAELRADTNKAIAELRVDTNKALAEIRADIKKLIAATPHVLAGTSPLRLTDLGEEVSQCVSAAALAEQMAPGLIDEMKGKHAYEVQEFCIDYMRDEYQPTTEQDQSFKECAYEQGIKLKQVLDVCAIELRDKLLHLLDSKDTV